MRDTVCCQAHILTATGAQHIKNEGKSTLIPAAYDLPVLHNNDPVEIFLVPFFM
jgi:hypothetical protein